MKSFRLITAAAMLFVLAPAASQASIMWNGSVDTNWSNGDNWDGGSAPGSGDVATFAGAATANQPDLLGGTAAITTIDFQSAGWTISSTNANVINFRTVNAVTSSGAGVNVIDAPFNDQYVQDMTFTANAGNTLVMKQGYTNRRDYVTAGDGMVVFEGIGTSPQTWTMNAGTTLFNTPSGQQLDANSSVAAGSTVGGTAEALIIKQYSSLVLADGAMLSPGGDGDMFGALISTLRLKSSSSTVRAYTDMGGSSSSLVMDIGSTLGSNDQIIVDLAASNGYFYLQDSTLALRGSGVLQDGDYTLVVEASGNYNGTFGAITYNGAPVDPANFSLSYREDSIVLTVADVPEPATLGLLAAGALAMIRRR